MTDQQTPLISHYAKKVPIHVLGEGIGQFLCRTTFNNLRLTSKDVHLITERMIRPWPHKSLLVGKTSVQSIAFSPDGSKLCCRDRSGTIHVWDRSIGNEKSWRGSLRSACLGNIVCSPDNRFLAFDGKSKSIQVCSIQDGKSMKSLHGHQGGITSLCFHADGRTLASASTDSTIRLWNLGTGKCQRIMRRHRGFVYSVTFSPDGQRLASAGSDRTIRIWNPFGNHQDDILMLRGHSLVVVSLSFSPTNSNLLASGSLDGTLRLWDVLNQSCLKCVQLGSEVLTVCFAPSGIRLAAGRSDETIVLWNVEEEKEEAEYHGRLLSFAPDGVTLATAGRDGIVKLQSI